MGLYTIIKAYPVGTIKQILRRVAIGWPYIDGNWNFNDSAIAFWCHAITPEDKIAHAMRGVASWAGNAQEACRAVAGVPLQAAVARLQ